jgi:predicted ATPase
LNAAVQQSPVLLLLDDLHWADDGSLELFAYLARRCAAIPVLLLGTARPIFDETHPDWLRSLPNHTRLDLQPLTPGHSRLLLHDILQKMPDIPATLQETIVTNAEGNPFYVEEYVKMLIDVGVIIKGDEHWQVDLQRLGELHVPPTLTGILQARLDRLSQPERTVLQQASVVGRIFWDDALHYLRAPVSVQAEASKGAKKPAALPANNYEALFLALDSLTRRELVFHRQTSAFAGTQEYIFKHAILRDVTYEQVLKSHRRQYHRQAAEWLIEKSSQRAGEYAGLIAEHFEHAGENRLAAEWYQRAGHSAQEAYLPDLAIEYYQRGLGLLGAAGSPARRIPFYEGLGEAFSQRAKAQETRQAYQDMLAAAGQAGDVPAQVRAWNGLWAANELEGLYRDALQAAEQAERLLRAAAQPDLVGLAHVLWEKGRTLNFLSRYQEALDILDEGLTISQQAGSQAYTARHLNWLGGVHSALGNFEQAIVYKTRSLAIWRSLGNRQFESALLNNLGESYRMQGDYEQAITHYQQALEIARSIRNLSQEIVTLNNLGAHWPGQFLRCRRFPGAGLLAQRGEVFHRGREPDLPGRGLPGPGAHPRSPGRHPESRQPG